MIKTKLAITIDSLVISIITAILSYLWLNRYLKNAILSIFICNLILISLFFILFKFFTKKYNLENIKLKDVKLAENCFNHLKYCSQEESNKYFNTLLNTKSHGNNIYENKELYFYINLKSPMSTQDFFIANEYYLNSKKDKPLVFVSIGETDDFNKLYSTSPISYHTYNQTELFELMQTTKIFPIEQENVKLKTFKFQLKTQKLKFSKSFTKQNFKHFLFSGLSLILISLFIPYTYYYLIFGTILLIFAIICLFAKNSVDTKPKEKLTDLIKK